MTSWLTKNFWRLYLATLIVLLAGTLWTHWSQAAVTGEWRVNLLKGSSTVQPASVGATQEAAWAACLARIPASAATSTTYRCQTPVYVAVVTVDPPVPPQPPTTAMVYATTAGGTYANLQGASVSGAISVRLAGDCSTAFGSTGPWTFSVDNVARNTEAQCPYALIDDNALLDTTTLPNGSHTVKAVSGATEVSATFTVSNAPPPLGLPTLSSTQAPNSTNPANTNVTLTWTAVTGATSYQLERCTGAGCTSFTALAGATASPYANLNLPGGFTFNYRAKASDGSRTSISNVVTVVTPVVGSGSTTIEWEHDGKNTDGTPATLAGFRIFYGTSAAALSQSVQAANPTLRAYQVTGLAAGTWYFAARAYSTTGAESDNSNVISKVIP